MTSRKEIKRQETIKSFITRSKKAFGDDRFGYDLVTGSFTGMGKNTTDLVCNVHNVQFTTTPANHLKTASGGCPECKSSAKSKRRRSKKSSGKSEKSSGKTKKRKTSKVSPEDKLNAQKVKLAAKGSCSQCGKECSCSKCRTIVNRILREGITHHCGFPKPKDGIPCSSFLKEGEVVCKKHAKLHEDQQNDIRRCFRNGCHEVLTPEDKKYCAKCKKDMREATRKLRRKRDAENLSKAAEENPVPEDFRAWMAGFFDGDGTIRAQRFGDSNGFNIAVEFCQADARILQRIASYYPNMYTASVAVSDSYKPVFNLAFNGQKSERVLKDMFPFLILKADQAKSALKFIEIVGSHDKFEEKLRLYEKIKSLKNQYASVSIPQEKLTKPYVAGLWDAEGCVILTSKTRSIKLSQDQCHGILVAIAKKFGGGYYGAKDMLWDSKPRILHFCSTFEPYVYLKRLQLLCIHKYLCNEMDREIASALISNDKYRLRPDIVPKPVSSQEALEWSIQEQLSVGRKLPSLKKLKKVPFSIANFGSELQSFHDQVAAAMNMSDEEIASDNKMFMLETKIDFVKTPGAYYESLIFDSNSFDPTTFCPEIAVVGGANDPLYRLWEWFHIYTASYKTTSPVGRRIKYLVREKHTGQYLGLLCIASDIYAYEARDKVIGWSSEARKIRLKNIANIVTCVPLQPFGYNFNGGKLLAMLCFSDEVLSSFEQKYDTVLAALTTFSLRSHSIMYSQTYLKRVGKTKGYNLARFPERLYKKGISLLKSTPLEKELSDVDQHQWKLNRTRIILKACQIDSQEMIAKNPPRGVYIGYTAQKQKSIEFLKGFSDSFRRVRKSSAQITQEWLCRWGEKRPKALKGKGQFRENDPFREDVHLKTKSLMIRKEQELLEG